MKLFISFLLGVVALISIVIAVYSLVIDKYALALTFVLLWIVSLGCLVGIIWEGNKHRKLY